MRRRAGFIVAAALLSAACQPGGSPPAGDANLATDGSIAVTWQFPTSLDSTATLADAAAFAWQEFFALNWPAVPQNGNLGDRDTPDTTQVYGSATYAGPLVWHTYRNKVEIFPGTGNPPGYSAGAANDFGYDSLPRYVYASTYSASPLSTPGPTPWINVDENSEIGEDGMFAGVVQTDVCTGQQILFLAKANRTQYVYTVRNNFWGADQAHQDSIFGATAAYVAANRADPPPGSASASAAPDSLVSFPTGTVELKSAWRALTDAEKASGRFFQTRVRYYCADAANDTVFVAHTLGMVALHIIHKTANQPFFVFATFEQVDNLLTADGQPVEDSIGNLIANQNLQPTEADISSVNGTQPTTGVYDSTNLQRLSPLTSSSTPGARLFYRNTSTFPSVPQGIVSLNRRVHTIPQTIIDANQQAQEAMTAYFGANNIANSPLRYYKLINVQYQPMTKPAGQTYTGADAATYYQANSVVETDYNLQTFSGIFQPSSPLQAGIDQTSTFGLITDWLATGDTAFNVQFAGKSYLMGGCMGCHGNAQKGGTNFSFILGGSDTNPEPADSASYQNANRFLRTFIQRQPGRPGAPRP